MLLGVLYSRQKRSKLYVSKLENALCVDAGSQHIESLVETSNINEIIPFNYAHLAFCVLEFDNWHMTCENFDRCSWTCAYSLFLTQRGDLSGSSQKKLSYRWKPRDKRIVQYAIWHDWPDKTRTSPLCYHAEFGRSALNGIGMINKAEPPKLRRGVFLGGQPKHTNASRGLSAIAEVLVIKAFKCVRPTTAF